MSLFITDNEQRFRDWMRRQVTPEGVRRYTDNAIIAYSHSLRTSCMEITPYIAGNLFNCTSSTEFDNLYEQITHADNFDTVNKESGNGTFLTALKLYQYLLKHGIHSTAPELSAAFYLQNNSLDDQYEEDRGLKFHYTEVPMNPIQRIFYGAPGVGKSYTVNKLIETFYPDPDDFNAHCKRLIFHPTYTYEDFVGTIRPMLSQDRPMEHLFMPGPLTSLLKSAFSNPAEPYFLIIEEINRGNAPAIFGDLFQLLDRQPSGKSKYPVQNYEMSSFFAKDPGLKNIFIDSKVWFPPNFNIVATMNTADENIFILDNAFKRRFALKYVFINLDNLPADWTRSYDIFAGTKSLTTLFKGSDLEEFVNQLNKDGKLNRDWPTFARLTNKIIDINNKRAINAENPQLARIVENKKLGPFFVSPADLSQRDTFINKVIFYLKQDVFTYSDHYMTDSYEEIYLKYIENGADIFELLK